MLGQMSAMAVFGEVSGRPGQISGKHMSGMGENVLHSTLHMMAALTAGAQHRQTCTEDNVAGR